MLVAGKIQIRVTRYICFVYPATKLLEHMVLNGPDGAVAAAQSECSAEVVAHIKEVVNEKDANHRDVVKKFGSSCRKLFPYLVFHEWEGIFRFEHNAQHNRFNGLTAL